MKKEKFDSLRSSDMVAIFMHRNPDPDSIGSAVGMQHYLRTKEIKSHIYYSGEISHPENKALMNVLSFSFLKIEDIQGCKKDFFDNEYQYTIVVDCTEKNTGIDEPDFKVDMILDHHRVKVTESEYDFVRIESIGSCSTIIYDEFISTLTDELNDKIATAMLYGIIKDTDNFLSENVTDKDFEAHRMLVKFANKQNIYDIQKYPLPDYIFELESVAMDTDNFLEMSGTFVTFLGKISDGKRDILPYLADKYMRKENITTSIVTAIVGSNLSASLRTTNVSIDITQFAKQLFGKEYAGGKSRIAGATVPLNIGFLSISDDLILDEITELVKKKILNTVKREISREI